MEIPSGSEAGSSGRAGSDCAHSVPFAGISVRVRTAKANAENAEERTAELLGCGGTRFLRCHFIAFFGQLHQGEERVIHGSGNTEFCAAAGAVAVERIAFGALAAN